MKLTCKVNYRVVVDWRRQFGSEPLNAQTANEIANIVNNLKDVEAMVLYEVEHYCSFCNLIWEEDDDGCPVCCEAAVAEWEKEHTEKSE